VSVFVRPFAHVARRLRTPRVLVTPHLMVRTIGLVGDRSRQRDVVEAALRLLAEAGRAASGPGAVTRPRVGRDRAAHRRVEGADDA
jgi:hypothetical protein